MKTSMNDTMFTPGPWTISCAYGNGSAIWISPAEGANMVLQGANCLRSDSVKYEQISIGQLVANATLIAAAPDLLEALKMAQVRLFVLDGSSAEYKAAGAAMAKATVAL